MAITKPILAFIYDFDKTLCIDDMQNFSFIPALGMTPKQFWDETTKFSEESGTEKILAYMYMMIYKCKEKGINITREYLNSLGKDVKFYDGVTTWFKRINAYGEEKGIQIEHYILSSGTSEIIEGTQIAKEFTRIFGCEFIYSKDTNTAIWPKNAVNYTSKTQYLYRISKGALDIQDDLKVNQRIETKHVQFRNMVYLGDGLTDVPCMAIVHEKGGRSIAVYPKGNEEKVKQLYADERINYYCAADYRAGSKLEKFVKLIIDSTAATEMLLHKENELGEK